MRKRLKSASKFLAFVLIFAVLLSVASTLVQPVWLSWNNYYTQKGFYNEKKNTIETIFLGPSTMLTDLIPTELYEDYGICAYNLCTEQQPVLASYIWAEEAYKYHSETLKTVVFCVSELRDSSGSSIHHKALDNLKPSYTKFKALTMYRGNIFEAALDMIPLYSYHGRWEEMTTDDLKNVTLDPDNGTRGYHFDSTVYGYDYVRRTIKNVTLDESAKPQELVETSVKYFEELVRFCEEKGLKLVLTKAPAKNWNSALHNAVEELAKKHGLEFYDFNYGTLYDELNLIDIYDSTDGGTHMNYYGATKITDWFGKYLTENCAATDVRGNPDYAFMDEQLERFDAIYRQQMELRQTEDITDFLKLAVNENTTVFIMLNDTVTENLTDEQRKYFKDTGLNKLSEIKDGDSYVAVIEGGKVTKEKLQAFDYMKSTYSLSYSEKMSDGAPYKLVSGGSFHGKTASCLIDGEEYAANERGINVVVYNNKYDEFMYSTYFDTHISPTRDCYKLSFGEEIYSGDYDEALNENEIFSKALARYNDIEKLRKDKEITLSVKNNYLFALFEDCLTDDNAVIVLTAKGDAAKSFTDDNRTRLKYYGLEKLSEYSTDGAYIAVIDSDGVVYEESAKKGSVLTYEDDFVTVTSGEKSSVIIDSTEHSSDKNGLNIVVFNKETGEVLVTGAFDTVNSPIKEPVWQ